MIAPFLLLIYLSFSYSASKESEARDLGAHHFLLSTDAAQVCECNDRVFTRIRLNGFFIVTNR